MQLFHRKIELSRYLSGQRDQGKNVGFVPTMGALHEGHLQLVRTANSDNDVVVVSVFVNPTQFNSTKDLARYPRQLNEDIRFLSQSFPEIVVFAPSADEMYPSGTPPEKYDLAGLDMQMEGEHRPGHFQGVVAIVDRFFSIAGRCKAYFGEKDFQQLRIIQHIAESLSHPVTIVPVPTVREESGLAMSSRNVLLSPEVRSKSSVIYKAMKSFVSAVQAGNADLEELKKNYIATVEADGNFKVEYISVADTRNLKQVESLEKGASCRLFTAVFAGNVRLIDNMPLN
jgi:pantoate--beta-alanine ligase